jgi:hypothetical protein
MNKRIMAVAILTLVLTPTFQTLRAEMKEGGHGKRHEMKEKLGLSEDQEKKLADLRTAEKAELKPLHEKNKAVVEKTQRADPKQRQRRQHQNHTGRTQSQPRIDETSRLEIP